MPLFKKRRREEDEISSDEFVLPEPPPLDYSRKDMGEFTEDLDTQNFAPLPKTSPVTRVSSMPPSVTFPTSPLQEYKTPRERPIFIKLDKYESALETLKEIKERVRKASVLLEKIKEIRAKEQEELESWQNELEQIKDKLNAVDEKLFSRVEY
ncbi:MAG: hypothetical protein AABX59_04065 [Nanoarchaeota archaeon]